MTEIDEEVNMDEIMGMIKKMPDEITPEDVQEIEENHESSSSDEELHQELKEDIAPQQSTDAQLLYETMHNNLRLKEELEQLRAAKEQAEMIALQGAIRSFETQIESVGSDNNRLKGELIRARDEGDTAASVEIENQMRENFERVRDLKGKVEQYSPMLNAPRESQQPRESRQSTSELAAQWVKDNENWLTDPKFSDKREYANKIFQDLQSSRADMNSLSFWTKLEKGISEFEHSKRLNEDSKQHRMPKNMVTYNSNGSNANNKKPASYKDNPEFVQKVAHLVKNVIKNEDVLKDQKLLNSTLQKYYKVWKDGNAKYWPTTLN